MRIHNIFLNLNLGFVILEHNYCSYFSFWTSIQCIFVWRIFIMRTSFDFYSLEWPFFFLFIPRAIGNMCTFCHNKSNVSLFWNWNLNFFLFIFWLYILCSFRLFLSRNQYIQPRCCASERKHTRNHILFVHIVIFTCISLKYTTTIFIVFRLIDFVGE